MLYILTFLYNFKKQQPQQQFGNGNGNDNGNASLNEMVAFDIFHVFYIYKIHAFLKIKTFIVHSQHITFAFRHMHCILA